MNYDEFDKIKQRFFKLTHYIDSDESEIKAFDFCQSLTTKF